MVGLPYPNLHSPELKEKMSYLSRTVPADGDGKQGGQVRLENLWDICFSKIVLLMWLLADPFVQSHEARSQTGSCQKLIQIFH